jgi:uncharacterized protein YndB with AHSA1/START domain/DNA-binding transcriptional ArsR family regulator
VDDIFRALSDPSRRMLLDLLRERDGRTLTELEKHLAMTRFGVMKHLKVLEDAHLVVTRKVGREKFHYLNPAPIQQISDRWISRYASPFVRTMSDLKTQLEQKDRVMPQPAPKHVHEMFIRAPAEAVWALVTDDEKTPLWQHFNMNSQTEWREGGRIEWIMNGNVVISGEIVELAPPHRFVITFHAKWSPDVAADKPSRVTWEITPLGNDACKLTLVHDNFEGETATYRAVTSGWVEALSRLKTLIETGVPFTIDHRSMAEPVA